MPELPEVETVVKGLNHLLGLPQGKPVRVKKLEFLRKDLRKPIPIKKLRELEGQCIQVVSRRAKYILFSTDRGTLLNHLGMTGYWRQFNSRESLRSHDHFVMHFMRGPSLVFNDTRRFGIIDFIHTGKENRSPWLQHLGPEPFTQDFSGEYLWSVCRGRVASVKAVIMDQKVVVGVGNIYACEALFMAGIRPQTPANKLSKERAVKLVEAIREILLRAINAGGTTIRDFRQAGGDSGYFAQSLTVYGRSGEPCVVCKGLVSSRSIAGRNSFWCSRCQF